MCNSSLWSSNVETIGENQLSISRPPNQPTVQESKLVCILRLVGQCNGNGKLVLVDEEGNSLAPILTIQTFDTLITGQCAIFAHNARIGEPTQLRTAETGQIFGIA